MDDLLRAIIADPSSDWHREVYADWLEDRGDNRGVFIRAQLELARIGPPRREIIGYMTARRDGSGIDISVSEPEQLPLVIGERIDVRERRRKDKVSKVLASGLRVVSYNTGIGGYLLVRDEFSGTYPWDRVKVLKEQEKDYFKFQAKSFCPVLPPNGVMVLPNVTTVYRDEIEQISPYILSFNRGFPAVLLIDLERFTKDGPQICKNTPLQTVQFNDVDPNRNTLYGEVFWSFDIDRRSDLPLTFMLRLEKHGRMEESVPASFRVFFGNRQSAIDALSKVAIECAKEQP